MSTAALARVPTAPALPTTPRARPRATLALPALLLLALAVPACVAMVLAAALIGPFIMFALPPMLAFGCALGPLVAIVRGEL